MPIVTDVFVDKEFGTGAVKITPAHDFNDYDVGIRNKLPFIECINDDGLITNVCALLYLYSPSGFCLYLFLHQR